MPFNTPAADIKDPHVHVHSLGAIVNREMVLAVHWARCELRLCVWVKVRAVLWL